MIAAAALGSEDALATYGRRLGSALPRGGSPRPVLGGAHRGLPLAPRVCPGFEHLVFDPLAPPDERARAARDVVRHWEQAHGRVFDPSAVHLLVAERDDRALTLSE